MQGMPHGVQSGNDQELSETKKSDKNYDDKRSRCGGEGNRSWAREKSSSTDSHVAATADIADNISLVTKTERRWVSSRRYMTATKFCKEQVGLNWDKSGCPKAKKGITGILPSG